MPNHPYGYDFVFSQLRSWPALCFVTLQFLFRPVPHLLNHGRISSELTLQIWFPHRFVVSTTPHTASSSSPQLCLCALGARRGGEPHKRLDRPTEYRVNPLGFAPYIASDRAWVYRYRRDLRIPLRHALNEQDVRQLTLRVQCQRAPCAAGRLEAIKIDAALWRERTMAHGAEDHDAHVRARQRRGVQ